MNEKLAKTASDSMALLSLMAAKPEPVALKILGALRTTSDVAVVLQRFKLDEENQELPDAERADDRLQPSSLQTVAQTVPASVGRPSEHQSPIHPSVLHQADPSDRAVPSITDPVNMADGDVSAGNMWTEVTTDTALIRHLLNMYFSWEYPIFAPLSKEHFMKDFEDGTLRFCSPLLVNALLSLGCCFSSRPDARSVPDDPLTTGNHFFEESLRLFYLQTDHYNLTTVQALGVLSVREANLGRNSESGFFASQSMRLAVEMGLHRDLLIPDTDKADVVAATYWGSFTLNSAWALVSGAFPQSSIYGERPRKPTIVVETENLLWIPYTDEGWSTQLRDEYRQPSNVRTVFHCICEMSELVHQASFVLRSPGYPLTRQSLLSLYTNYLNWYDGIPDVLKSGHNSTPAVLFLHLYYHFAIILMFRPPINTQILNSTISSQDVCIQAADAIQALLGAYANLYTLRRVSSFIPYFALAASITRLTIYGLRRIKLNQASDASPVAANIAGMIQTETSPGPASPPAGSTRSPPPAPTSTPPPPSPLLMGGLDNKAAEDIRKGIVDLATMECRFAELGHNMLQRLAKQWDVDITSYEDTTTTFAYEDDEQGRRQKRARRLLELKGKKKQQQQLQQPGTTGGGGSSSSSSTTPRAGGPHGDTTHSVFVPENDFEVRFIAMWDKTTSLSGGGTRTSVWVGASINSPLFSLSGSEPSYPMALVKEALEKAGFALLNQ